MFICITSKEIRLLYVESWNTMFPFNNKSNIYTGNRTFNKDLFIYNKTGISIQGSSSISIEGHNTQQYQYQYSTGNFLYYTKT